MELLLRRNRLGEVLEGSDKRLLERANCGDDITLYEESSVFSLFCCIRQLRRERRPP